MSDAAAELSRNDWHQRLQERKLLVCSYIAMITGGIAFSQGLSFATWNELQPV